MHVYLLYPDQDDDPNQSLPSHADDVRRDLALSPIIAAMAQGDQFIATTVQRVMLALLTDLNLIRYRQAALQDCLRHPSVIRELYRIPLQAFELKRKRWLGLFGMHYPSSILSEGRGMLVAYFDLLKALRQLADQHGAAFQSPAFSRLFTMIQQELSDDYLAAVEHHLRQLSFRDGMLVSARLGRGNEPGDYVLCKPNQPQRNWLQRLVDPTPSYTYTVPPKDEAGSRILGDLRDRSLNVVADAVAQAATHVEGFFKALQRELAFYIGCLNLAEQLAELNLPLTFPEPLPLDQRHFTCQGLYDLSLALTTRQPVIGNEIDAGGKALFVITGANQGGKSTFLRSVGIGQLLMQCGMFVPALSLSANVCSGVFTHYKREEDATMNSGKLDEELARMSAIIDQIQPHALILLNESFAATNEQEGSEIARQIISALLDNQIKLLFVTHLYDFARGWWREQRADTIFLRAERQADGSRTFKLQVAEPQATGYGADLYYRVVGETEPAAGVDSAAA
ncbi:MAG: DNA mismatch repair protein MutS [Chloroflexus sp.]|nr:DNA mismatch repair protein MutS [Chloroflexus sp.]